MKFRMYFPSILTDLVIYDILQSNYSKVTLRQFHDLNTLRPILHHLYHLTPLTDVDFDDGPYKAG
jgi:hypothetical protein